MRHRQIASSVVLSMVRRGREVAWAPEAMRLGNLLYLGLWAFEGSGRRVLLHDSRRDALGLFPRLRDALFLSRARVRITDRRVHPWHTEARDPDKGFIAPRLGSYIQELLLPGSPVRACPAELRVGDLVVNVRRGDYFGTPYQAEFGMNTAAYTRQAVVEAVELAGTPRRIVIVSDDLNWCSAHLVTSLRDVAPTQLLVGSPTQDMAALIHAERVVLPNSTFSYWGGYIGDELYPGRQVIAPQLFAREMNGGRAHQLRPHWHVVRAIPGGWDATGP